MLCVFRGIAQLPRAWKYIMWEDVPILVYRHVSGVLWRTITGSGLDDWIYWRLLFTVSLNHNLLQELTINLQPRTRSILVLILILRLTILSVVLRHAPLYSPSLDSLSSTAILLQFLKSQFRFSNPLATNSPSLNSLSRTPMKTRVTCYQECVFIGWYLAIDILLLLRANFGNVFTEQLPSNGHTRHNIFQCNVVKFVSKNLKFGISLQALFN
jgi:hypothetical protein